MKPDFSGYATKAGLKCSDGRTIMPEAFKHMDGMQVPLVWHHGHKDPANVLGHVKLEARNDGMYCEGFFNNTKPGLNAKALVQHKDVNSLSIYANQLVERSKKVFHGMIREVSLVLSGANPGATIDFVELQHADGEVETLTDEAVIHTGLELEHAEGSEDGSESGSEGESEESSGSETKVTDNPAGSDDEDDDEEVEHAASDASLQDVYDTLDDDQKKLVHYMIGAALEEAATSSSASHSDDDNDDNEGDLNHQEGNEDMGKTHNVFESGNENNEGYSLSHDDVKGIVAAAVKCGSLKEAAEDFALKHGIDDIDILFPEARAVDTQPEWNKRRTEWVAGVLDAVRKTPFSRIKTLSADITFDEARARGYIKGTLKKEEYFGIAKRITTPTTVYKKQKLDRDDVLDITDFDVVMWLKGEMRLMLEEEIARAILIGDGRDVDDDDKIKDPAGASEGAGIRSIVNDHELYATRVNAVVADSDPDWNDVVETVMRGRRYYKGTGSPTFYTSTPYSMEMLLAKDGFGRRRYNSTDELATALGAKDVVNVEVLESMPDVIGILVNLQDYALGADKGGETSFFDDFDIDYNQHKYLYETRLSGALTKIKSALVIIREASGSVLIVPVAPTFEDGDITIPTDAHVTYFADGSSVSDGSTVTVASGETVEITAVAASGYYFATSENDQWSFTNDA